jgi:orotidine-5'-phosphate decarboxylase
MTRKELIQTIRTKRSFLCLGLDTDAEKIPEHLHKYDDPVFEFNKEVIDTVHDLIIAVKPNFAFYESRGAAGWQSLTKTVKYIRAEYPELFLIADAKRCDIGNSSKMYARSFFDHSSSGLDFDAVTVSPYMGEDSVLPFLSYPGKWVIILALTSNKGAIDFQFFKNELTGERLFEKIIRSSLHWGNTGNIMYVAGATQASMLTAIREIIPEHFLLVPGVGEQGGNLKEVILYGMNKDCGLIVNVTRTIICSGKSTDFQIHVRKNAVEIQREMQKYLSAT